GRGNRGLSLRSGRKGISPALKVVALIASAASSTTAAALSMTCAASSMTVAALRTVIESPSTKRCEAAPSSCTEGIQDAGLLNPVARNRRGGTRKRRPWPALPAVARPRSLDGGLRGPYRRSTTPPPG